MSTWQRRKETRRKLRYCRACDGTGRVVTHRNIMTDAVAGTRACTYCNGTGRKMKQADERSYASREVQHDADCACWTCRENDRLGYDADLGDRSQYCKHGRFIGSWWGPDYICGACEDGIAVCADCERWLSPCRYKGEPDVPAGYDYLGEGMEPGRYSETYHTVLCRTCERKRNDAIAEDFAVLDRSAVTRKRQLRMTVDLADGVEWI
jgi:hypothetical protein